MMQLSISQLKTRPRLAIAQAADFPVAIANRNTVQAYLVGKDLYEKMILYIEDFIDRHDVKQTDFSKGRDFETVAKKLGI